ncbi:hypothetical protein CLF_110237 [Clonorchis sinensis]|uniref:Uncharacterized protein n=1 Tax=Clonorchis sinensis TaxID=79923 RepID=G7YKF7_CLOSI|nr:hypothetical protein CLF_110237 [Clonorchis sinensis]
MVLVMQAHFHGENVCGSPPNSEQGSSSQKQLLNVNRSHGTQQSAELRVLCPIDGGKTSGAQTEKRQYHDELIRYRLCPIIAPVPKLPTGLALQNTDITSKNMLIQYLRVLTTVHRKPTSPLAFSSFTAFEDSLNQYMKKNYVAFMRASSSPSTNADLRYEWVCYKCSRHVHQLEVFLRLFPFSLPDVVTAVLLHCPSDRNETPCALNGPKNALNPCRSQFVANTNYNNSPERLTQDVHGSRTQVRRCDDGDLLDGACQVIDLVRKLFQTPVCNIDTGIDHVFKVYQLAPCLDSQTTSDSVVRIFEIVPSDTKVLMRHSSPIMYTNNLNTKVVGERRQLFTRAGAVHAQPGIIHSDEVTNNHRKNANRCLKNRERHAHTQTCCKKATRHAEWLMWKCPLTRFLLAANDLDDRLYRFRSQRSVNGRQLYFFETVAAAYDAGSRHSHLEQSPGLALKYYTSTYGLQSVDNFPNLKPHPPYLVLNYLFVCFMNLMLRLSAFRASVTSANSQKGTKESDFWKHGTITKIIVHIFNKPQQILHCRYPKSYKIWRYNHRFEDKSQFTSPQIRYRHKETEVDGE